MTKQKTRALELIRLHVIDSPGQFAWLMWPDAPGWKRLVKAGPNGVCHGGGMRLAGGGYLGKLKKAGLIARSPLSGIYHVTPQGVRDMVAENGGVP